MTKTSRSELIFGSLSRASTVPPYCSGPAVATTSTGLEIIASLKTSLPKVSLVFELNSANLSPAEIHSSTPIIAGPPVLVTITTLSPFGTGWLEKAMAASTMSSWVSKRRTPLFLNIASAIVSCSTNAPV